MVRVSKNLIFCIAVILLCSNLYMIESSSAQISKPSVPNFTLALQDGAVVLSIENQPFDIHNSDNYSFYYNVRIMNAGGYWSFLYEAENTPPTQSSSNSTTLTYPVAKSDIFPSLTTVDCIPILTTGEAAFQVIAMVGNWEKTTYSDGTVSYGLKGYVSGWSGSQTITLPSSNTSSPTIYGSSVGKMSTSYKLTMFNPNDQTIHDAILPLQFMIIWTYDLMPLFEPKTDYAYSIDGNPFVCLTANKTSNDHPGGDYTFVGNPSFSYLLDVSNLTNGRHEIKIRAGFTFGHLLLNDTSTPFTFTVQNSNPHLTPNQTPNPTPTPTVPEIPTTITLISILTATILILIGKRR